MLMMAAFDHPCLCEFGLVGSVECAFVVGERGAKLDLRKKR